MVILFCLLASPNNLFAWEPEQLNRFFRQGEYLYEQAKYKEAIREFQKVLEIDPGNIFAKDYIKKSEQNLRLKVPSLKKKLTQEEKWQKQELRLSKVKAKQEKIQKKQEQRFTRIQSKQEKYLARQRQKEEAIKQKERDRLNRVNTKKEFHEAERQTELLRKQKVLEAKQERIENLAKAKLEKEAKEKERKDRIEKSKAQELAIAEINEEKIITTPQEKKQTPLAKRPEQKTETKVEVSPPFRLKLNLQKIPLTK